MCHSLLHDPKLYTLLTLADEERAAQVRLGGCACGGVLHSARYPRKPRGGPPAQGRRGGFKRLSFCCNVCRRRQTPQSVLYLGRRVYLGVVVLLASAMRGALSGAGLRQLCEQIGVPGATLDRWRGWWNRDLVASPFWQASAGCFMPPIAGWLPGALLARFTGPQPLTRLMQALRFVAPLSTVTEGRRP